MNIIQNLEFFIATVFLLSITPGPCMLLALYGGINLGIKRTQILGIGDYIGLMLYLILSILGIGALMQSSPNLLKTLQYAGAIYLIFLGIKPLLHNKKENITPPKIHMKTTSNKKLLQIGFMTLLANPKAILFYSAFLPNFIRNDTPLLPQFIIMLFFIILSEFIAFNIYAFGGKSLQKIIKNDTAITFLSSTVLIGIAIWLLLK